MGFRRLVDKILTHSMEKFGEDVKFYPKGGGVFPVRGVFNNEYGALDLDTTQVVSVNNPALGINLNDIKFPLTTGDEVEIRGQRFLIQDKREDGQGGAMLLLHRKRANEPIKDTKAR